MQPRDDQQGPKPKQRRARRTEARGAVIRPQERDLWCLEVLAKCKFLLTDQIKELLFDDARSYATKRLRRLVDAGLIRTFERPLSEPNVYALTKSGLSALRTVEASDFDNVTIPRVLDGNLDHLLRINSVRIALARGLGSASGTLAWWWSDWELPRKAKRGVVPDALFSVRWEADVTSIFALELDNETRSPAAFMQKLRRYKQSRSQPGAIMGFNDVVILVVGTDARRLSRYRDAVAKIITEPWVWFAPADTLAADTVVSPIWQPVDGAEPLSLRDLSYLSLP